ncbi:unnamed protein product [Cylicocyclus nassatus]|uniref:Uncharacterized protein n=1 Tax=Cylicocyclus nassatus TaxID=53992 RepID=A0AA36HEU4_CYLNA|nr:unnamed protein product [Cylicocyclus nassatus]
MESNDTHSNCEGMIEKRRNCREDPSETSGAASRPQEDREVQKAQDPPDHPTPPPADLNNEQCNFQQRRQILLQLPVWTTPMGGINQLDCDAGATPALPLGNNHVRDGLEGNGGGVRAALFALECQRVLCCRMLSYVIVCYENSDSHALGDDVL